MKAVQDHPSYQSMDWISLFSNGRPLINDVIPKKHHNFMLVVFTPGLVSRYLSIFFK